MTHARSKYKAQRGYMERLRESGGQIVAVRMTAAQLAQLDALRIAEISESRSACVNRLIGDRKFATDVLRAK